MNKIITLFSITLFLLASAKPIHANALSVAGTSATPASSFTHVMNDQRAARLKVYLDSHNSPLADEAAFFIQEADRLSLDWRLVAAIAGTESTFGKHIPTRSYNAWGWAIFTGQQDGKHFASWKDGITTVSEGLRFKYMDKGAKTIEQIGHRYAASPRWSGNVQFFLKEISEFAPNGTSLLAITI